MFSLGLLSRLRSKHRDTPSSSAGMPLPEYQVSGLEPVQDTLSISNLRQRHGLLDYQDTGLEPMQRTFF